MKSQNVTNLVNRLAVTKDEINGALDSATVKQVSTIRIPQGILNSGKPYRVKSTLITVDQRRHRWSPRVLVHFSIIREIIRILDKKE